MTGNHRPQEFSPQPVEAALWEDVAHSAVSETYRYRVVGVGNEEVCALIVARGRSQDGLGG